MRNAQRAMSIDNISFISCSSSHNDDTPSTSNAAKDNHSNGKTELNNNSSMENLNKYEKKRDDDVEHEQENLIPWRAQLRKTNSRLSLVG